MTQESMAVLTTSLYLQLDLHRERQRLYKEVVTTNKQL